MGIDEAEMIKMLMILKNVFVCQEWRMWWGWAGEKWRCQSQLGWGRWWERRGLSAGSPWMWDCAEINQLDGTLLFWTDARSSPPVHLRRREAGFLAVYSAWWCFQAARASEGSDVLTCVWHFLHHACAPGWTLGVSQAVRPGRCWFSAMRM